MQVDNEQPLSLADALKASCKRRRRPRSGGGGGGRGGGSANAPPSKRRAVRLATIVDAGTSSIAAAAMCSSTSHRRRSSSLSGSATASTQASSAALAAVTTSINEVVLARQRQWKDHQRQIQGLSERLARVKKQLRGFRRTRRNVRSYNALLDRQTALQTELALLEMDQSDLSEFYDDLRDFLHENVTHSTKTNNDVGSEVDKGNAAVEKNTDRSVAATTTSGFLNDTTDRAPRGPAHRREYVTAGAPVFEERQYDLLTWGIVNTAACTAVETDRSIATSSPTTIATAPPPPRGPDDDLFDAAIANDARAHMCLDDMRPLVMVISPSSVGLPTVQTTTSITGGKRRRRRQPTAQEEALRERAMSICKRLRRAANGSSSTSSATSTTTSTTTTTEASGGGRKSSRREDNGLIMVTIGKAERQTAPSGFENRNRLNVKMKDIRNMQNTSMLNYVSVEQRETTEEEQQHLDLVEFLGEREQSRSATQPPMYDDPRCDACEEVLVVDTRTGMVSCPNPNCGLTYADGIDCHRLEPIRHEYHSKFEYLKSGHLMTLLKRFQSKESTVIPRDVIDKVVVQLVDREQITDMSQITIKKLKATLKKLALAKFYDHVWQLHYIITGEKPHQFTALQEQEFQAVFDVLETVYPLYKPKNAENFPFYWFVIRKTAQLLGHPDEVVAQFPMLKNPTKHRQKEKLWKKMMNHVGWPYYETAHVA